MLVVATRKGIANLCKSSYIAVSTGFWYEWGLAMPAAFGIDFAKRAVTLWDEGETKISTSTLPQVRPQPSVSFLTSDSVLLGWSCRRRSSQSAHQTRKFEQRSLPREFEEQGSLR